MRNSSLKLDIKMFNLCAWLTLVIAYVTPARIADTNTLLFGYPFSFLAVHKLSESRIPLVSNGLDILLFLINALIIYLIIKGLVFMKNKIRRDAS